MTRKAWKIPPAALLVAGLCAAAAAGAETIVEANVAEIVPGDAVAVSRIPDGVYLRIANDPDDAIWERLPEYRIHLDPAPPVHPSVDLRFDPDDPGTTIYFTAARTSDRLYMRLRWRDATMNRATTFDGFRDGVAVQFSLDDDLTSFVMGTGPDEPVNIWYWHADTDTAESLAAGGPGSTTRLPDQPVTASSRFQPGEDPVGNQWVVVMSRPLLQDGDYQVSFDRDAVPVAFAVWQGAEKQRDGWKSASPGWIGLELRSD